MRHSDFQIGMEFHCGNARWRCTDVGSRVIIAISLDPHQVVTVDFGATPAGQTSSRLTDDPSWLTGPPYAVVEHVFDEYDLHGCFQ